MYSYPPQDLHITLTTLAVPLAVVSTLLALGLLWQTWMRYRLWRAGQRGDASWWLSFTAVLLSAGHVLLLAGYYSIVAQVIRFGRDPDLVFSPQLCPYSLPAGVWPPRPCYPYGSEGIAVVSEIRMMWTLLVAASIWYVLSVWVLIAGIRARHAGRRTGQGQQGAVNNGTNDGSQYATKDRPMTATKVLLLGVLIVVFGLALTTQNVWLLLSRTEGTPSSALIYSVNLSVNVDDIAVALMVLGVVVGVAGFLKR